MRDLTRQQVAHLNAFTVQEAEHRRLMAGYQQRHAARQAQGVPMDTNGQTQTIVTTETLGWL